MEKSQISTREIRDRLINLGYTLIDGGDHWRTSAKYRNGTNPTSVFIYKNTGVWRDYGSGGSESFPFSRLEELSGGEALFGNTLFPREFPAIFKEDELMEKIYPKFYLDKLLPNYYFYNKRNISVAIQQMYRCGLSSSGKMYRRMTFPIFNEADQIIGWSGRTIDNKETVPKWKHLGKKRNWLYPYNLSDTFKTRLNDAETIFLVESIGDSLALTQNGVQEHLVLFGVSLSSKVLSKLIELNPKKILISLNNDESKEINTGMVNAAKIYLNLLSFFPAGKLDICFPPANDFGEAQTSDTDAIMSWLELQKVIEYDTNKALIRCLGLINDGHDILSQQHKKQLKQIYDG